MGIETEYGIYQPPPPAPQTTPSAPNEIARVLFRPINHQWGSSNIFTHNASRLYLDVGSHPEIATAECDNLTQLITYDRAGDEITTTSPPKPNKPSKPKASTTTPPLSSTPPATPTAATKTTSSTGKSSSKP